MEQDRYTPVLLLFHLAASRTTNIANCKLQIARTDRLTLPNLQFAIAICNLQFAICNRSDFGLRRRFSRLSWPRDRDAAQEQEEIDRHVPPRGVRHGGREEEAAAIGLAAVHQPVRREHD